MSSDKPAKVRSTWHVQLPVDSTSITDEEYVGVLTNTSTESNGYSNPSTGSQPDLRYRRKSESPPRSYTSTSNIPSESFPPYANNGRLGPPNTLKRASKSNLDLPSAIREEILSSRGIPRDENRNLVAPGRGQTVESSDSSDTELNGGVGGAYLCPVVHSAAGKELINTNIPCNIDQLFSMLFTESAFSLLFQGHRKITDMRQSDWKLTPGSPKSRKLTFVTPTGQSVGPKTANVTEIQTLLPASQPGFLYVIESESNNTGVPYADAFSIKVHFCIRKVSRTVSNLMVYGKVNFKKKVWVKSFIESNSMAGLVDYFTQLEKVLQDECAKINAGDVPPTPASKKTTTLLPPPSRPYRKNRRAPDIPVAGRSIRNISLGWNWNWSQVKLDNSVVLKIMIVILLFLIPFHAFLHIKLTNIENTLTMAYSREPTERFQEWLAAVEQQKEMQQREAENWQEVLASTISTLSQTENELKKLNKLL